MDIFPGVCQARGDREGTAQAGDVAEGCVTRERPGYGNSAEARAPPWTGGTGEPPAGWKSLPSTAAEETL